MMYTTRKTSTSVHFIVRAKCTLAASHAATWWVTLSMLYATGRCNLEWGFSSTSMISFIPISDWSTRLYNALKLTFQQKLQDIYNIFKQHRLLKCENDVQNSLSVYIWKYEWTVLAVLVTEYVFVCHGHDILTATGSYGDPLRQHLQSDQKSTAGGRKISTWLQLRSPVGMAERRRDNVKNTAETFGRITANHDDDRWRSAFPDELRRQFSVVGRQAEPPSVEAGVRTQQRISRDGQLRSRKRSDTEPRRPSCSDARTTAGSHRRAETITPGPVLQRLDVRVPVDWVPADGDGRRGSSSGEKGRQDAGGCRRRLRRLLAAVLRALCRRAVLLDVWGQRCRAQLSHVARLRQLSAQSIHLRHVQPSIPLLVLASHRRPGPCVSAASRPTQRPCRNSGQSACELHRQLTRARWSLCDRDVSGLSSFKNF